jgi:hypothetical protein
MLFLPKQIIIIAKGAKNVRESAAMKRCPNCNRVFEDTLAFCTDDGETLVDESFVLPSDAVPDEPEEETIIRHDPIRIDIPHPPKISAEQVNFQTQAPGNVIPVVIKKPGNTGKYFLFLIIGSIIGGGLVLGILVLLYSQLRNPNSNRPAENVQISGGKHDERNKTRKDSEFNGFVQSENANLRSAPNGTVLEALPQNDRLNIQERDGTWYRVTCEHGVSGWIHGNTIRFNDDETPF